MCTRKKNKTTEKRHRFFYSLIPNECRNSTELSSALFCGYLPLYFFVAKNKEKRTEKNKKKSTRKNFTFGVKTVTKTVCTDESYRIASLVRHLTVSKCFCETEQSTSAQFFFPLSFARSLLIRLVRVCFSCYVLSMYGMPLCPCLTFSWEFEWQANVFLYRLVAQLLVSKRVELNKIVRQANEQNAAVTETKATNVEWQIFRWHFKSKKSPLCAKDRLRFNVQNQQNFLFSPHAVHNLLWFSHKNRHIYIRSHIALHNIKHLRVFVFSFGKKKGVAQIKRRNGIRMMKLDSWCVWIEKAAEAIIMIILTTCNRIPISSEH